MAITCRLSTGWLLLLHTVNEYMRRQANGREAYIMHDRFFMSRGQACLFSLFPSLHVGGQGFVDAHLPGSGQPVNAVTDHQAFQGGDMDAAGIAAAERTAFIAGRIGLVRRGR